MPLAMIDDGARDRDIHAGKLGQHLFVRGIQVDAISVIGSHKVVRCGYRGARNGQASTTADTKVRRGDNAGMTFVRFLMLLSLVVWIGGIIFFAFVVAPS